MSIQIGLEIILNMSLFIILGNLSNSLPRAAAVHIPPGGICPQHQQNPQQSHETPPELRLILITFYTNPGTVHASPRTHATEPQNAPQSHARKQGKETYTKTKRAVQTAPATPTEGKRKPPMPGGFPSYLFIFNKSANTTNGKIKIQNIINRLHLLSLI